ncbi:MAG: RNA polymerase sigma factor, partial [Thermomicrobiales bacterium]
MVKRALADAAAFAPLYLRYIDSIHAHCFWRLGSREAAEDATSQVFIQALSRLAQFDSHRGTFRSWLFAIAHHILVDQHRKSHPAEGIEAVAEIPDSGLSPEERVIAAELGRSLQAALSQLSARERQVVDLRLAGLTGVEIGRVLGCRSGAVGAAQFRAIKRLRLLMGVDAESEGNADV